MTTEWDIELDEEQVETRQITLEEFDQALVAYYETKKAKELVESELKKAEEAKRLAESKVMEYLKITKKDSYEVRGVGKASLVKKLQVNTPSNPENKRKLFDWIFEKYGQDGLDKYQTINYQSLNSLYNEEAQEAMINKQQLEIPGLDLPTTRESLSFRRTT